MKKWFKIVTCSSFVATFMLVSCTKREPSERPVFPTAEYFTPSFASEGDTVRVLGLALDGSTVSLNGTTVSSWVENDNQVVKFVIPAGYQGGKVSIKLKDNLTLNFVDSLRIVDKIDPLRGVPMLLLSDFDGGGIRPAYRGADFNTGQWALESPVGATFGVNSGQLSIPQSPAGGDYMFNDVPSGAIGGVATAGWGGALTSRNELLNDGESSFPISLGEYTNSPIDFKNEPANYYLNFHYYGADLGLIDTVSKQPIYPTAIRVYLINPFKDISLWYAFSFTNGDNLGSAELAGSPFLADNKWHSVSIPLSYFRDGFSFKEYLFDHPEDLLKINSLQFTMTDSRVDSSNPKIQAQGKGPIRTAIDHVSITEGVPLYEVVNKK